MRQSVETRFQLIEERNGETESVCVCKLTFEKRKGGGRGKRRRKEKCGGILDCFSIFIGCSC